MAPTFLIFKMIVRYWFIVNVINSQITLWILISNEFVSVHTAPTRPSLVHWLCQRFLWLQRGSSVWNDRVLHIRNTSRIFVRHENWAFLDRILEMVCWALAPLRLRMTKLARSTHCKTGITFIIVLIFLFIFLFFTAFDSALLIFFSSSESLARGLTTFRAVR